MPVTSEAQRRAMFAASTGKSRLAIPAKVGKEFTAASAGVTNLPDRAPKKKTHRGRRGRGAGPPTAPAAPADQMGGPMSVGPENPRGPAIDAAQHHQTAGMHLKAAHQAVMSGDTATAHTRLFRALSSLNKAK